MDDQQPAKSHNPVGTPFRPIGITLTVDVELPPTYPMKEGEDGVWQIDENEE